jgi:hypothetical protein
MIESSFRGFELQTVTKFASNYVIQYFREFLIVFDRYIGASVIWQNLVKLNKKDLEN